MARGKPKVSSDQSVLERFLLQNINSRTKEALVNYRLMFDMKLAAAKREYDLVIYSGDVDRDGFDVIFDDRDTLKKVQLKTVMRECTTSWNIHRTMLRPDLDFSEVLGFEPSASGSGSDGGVIVVRLLPDNDTLNLEYLYTDVFVLTAFELGLVRKPKSTLKAKDHAEFRRDLHKGTSHETISVSAGRFVTAKSPECLLGLIGLHSNNGGPWRHHVLTLAARAFCGRQDFNGMSGTSNKALVDYVRDELLELCTDLEAGELDKDLS